MSRQSAVAWARCKLGLHLWVQIAVKCNLCGSLDRLPKITSCYWCGALNRGDK